MENVANFRETGPKLYVCSTPIGNLDDVSLRLLETLRTADILVAEDTRHTRKLLSKYDIHPNEMWSYHEHNAREREGALLDAWANGKTVALVSDAGTPIISDPGEHAAELAIEQGVPVVPIPGPSAVLAALVGSGLPAMPFTFVGFLPRHSKECRQALMEYGRLPWTFVFYEAPHRMEKTMREVCALWPKRRVALCRELTKRYETFMYGTAEEVCLALASEGARGEYVVVVGPPTTDTGLNDFADSAEKEASVSMETAIETVKRHMEGGERHKEAVRAVAAELGIRRKDLYDATLRELENDNSSISGQTDE